MCAEKPLYDHRIEHLKIMKSINDVDKKFKKLLGVLNAFNGSDEKPINIEDLDLFPLFEWVDLNPEVSIRKRKNIFFNYLNFDTIIMEGGKFGEHFHADSIESCEIIDGLIIDRLNGEVYNKGDVIHFEKGQRHKPEALANSRLKVIFKPHNKNDKE